MQEHRAAIAEEAEEGAAVLDAIRDATMPALAALCSPLPAGFSSAVVEDGTPPAEKKIAQREERGFVILDAFQRDSDADMRGGRYFGRLLTLLSTGTFAIVERSGTWSSRVGERSEWTTTLREVSAREVVEEFDAAEISGAIERALDAQISGAAARRTDEALQRAEKLRAISVLLEPERTVLPGLRTNIARKLWLSRQKAAGYSAGDARLDANQAADALAAKTAGRVIWRRRHVDEVAIVRTGDGRVIAIGEQAGPWGVTIGLLDERGRFQIIPAGSPGLR